MNESRSSFRSLQEVSAGFEYLRRRKPAGPLHAHAGRSQAHAGILHGEHCNKNTRRAYAHAVGEFAVWCDASGLVDLGAIEPVHVAAYVEQLQARLAAPSVKLQLAAPRVLFDWLVVGQILSFNLASSVRGPRQSIRKRKPPGLSAEEAKVLLDTIDVSTLSGLREARSSH